MLVLLLSPVPMVRGFGLLLVVGVVIAFLCALTAGSAALVLAGRRAREERTCRPRAVRVPPCACACAARALAPPGGARASCCWRTRSIASWQGSRWCRPRAGRDACSCVGLALAVLGWGLDTQTHVETDITKLVPQNLESLQNLNALERATGVGGELDLMVSAKDLTKPATIEWMSTYESAVLKRFGYSPTRGCGQARVCPAFSLPDLFAGSAATTGAGTTSAAASGRPADRARHRDARLRRPPRRSSRRPMCGTCSTRSRRTSPRT